MNNFKHRPRPEISTFNQDHCSDSIVDRLGRVTFTLLTMTALSLWLAGCATPRPPAGSEGLKPVDPHRTNKIHRQKSGWFLRVDKPQLEKMV